MRKKRTESFPENKYDINVIVTCVKEYFNETVGAGNGNRRNLSEEEQRIERFRLELLKAIRCCSYGDRNAKCFIKKNIKEWLVNLYCKGQGELEYIIPFSNPEQLSPIDRFDILLYEYERQYSMHALEKLLEECLNYIPCSDYYEIKEAKKEPKENRRTSSQIVIDEAAIRYVYEESTPQLSYNDKAEIISQRIYQYYKGHGIIDEMRDLEIDGISGGVSGIVVDEYEEKTIEGKESIKGKRVYESVWVFYHGTMLRMAFMSFGTQKELERVCKNIYRYGSPGQLSASKGYIANEMKDGSRVVVVRPPFSESWAFFLRKFGKKEQISLERLIRGKNSEMIIELLYYMIAGCQVIGITGEQGCGKTTFLKALIEYIPASYTLRIQELLFELHLRELYPDRNIVTFRETDEITGREGLDLQKKTDGTVNIIGEVATAAVAGWLVMVSQVASRFTLFTHHAKTTDSLIACMRNDLMLSAGFHDERIAEEQVRTAIRFDIHLIRKADGSRCIERISEIMQCPEKEKSSFHDLVILTADGYRYLTGISSETRRTMLDAMTAKQQDDFNSAENRWIMSNNI